LSLRACLTLSNQLSTWPSSSNTESRDSTKSTRLATSLLLMSLNHCSRALTTLSSAESLLCFKSLSLRAKTLILQTLDTSHQFQRVRSKSTTKESELMVTVSPDNPVVMEPEEEEREEEAEEAEVAAVEEV